MEAKVREILINSAGILIAVCCLISFYLCFFGVGDAALAHYLITKLLSLPISLYSTLKLVKFVDRGGISVTGTGKALIVLTYVGCFILSSLMILANIVLHAMEIIHVATDREARRLEAKRSTEEGYKRIYMRSEARAIARILDDSDRGDIMLDDGVTLTRYHQVALITLSGERYALLSPYGKSHLARSVAHAYLIGAYPTGEPSLIPVTDSELYDRIYNKYLELLEMNHS